jgi:ABC-type Fe3+-hydroxamate transport system substrate-binding protein
MIEIVDQLNRPICLKEPAKRIVSLVPSISEYLYYLGLDEKVIGITKFCIKPRIWFNTKNRIGGTKSISIKKIEDLKPDLIIANKEENSKEDINAICETNIVYISDINNLEEAYKALFDIGVLCNKRNESNLLISKIKSGFNQFNKLTSGFTCLYFIWKKPFMVAGENTFIHDLIQQIGLKNLAINLDSRYPVMSIEQVNNINPDFIFLSSEPFPFTESHLSQCKNKFPNSNVILVDGEAFSWYGSRLIDSIPYFYDLTKRLTNTCQ